MCEFCVSHGEGKKWFHNMRNYSAEVFNTVTSEPALRTFLRSFYHVLRRAPFAAYRWRQRVPGIYRRFVHPLVTNHQKKTHFGQVITLEEAEHILDNVQTIVRIPCVCRKVTTGDGARVCLSVGMDMTAIIKDVPYLKGFERLTAEEAKAFVRKLDDDGKMHTVWTFTTPFIGAICNCDGDCMAFRTQVTMDVAKVMWKGEAVAAVDAARCTGCGECVGRCFFNALTQPRTGGPVQCDSAACYGCGLCRTVCGFGALAMTPRAAAPGDSAAW